MGGAAAMTAIAVGQTIKGKIDMFRAAKEKVAPLFKKSKDLQERIVTDVEAMREECVEKVKIIKEKLKAGRKGGERSGASAHTHIHAHTRTRTRTRARTFMKPTLLVNFISSINHTF